MDEHDRRIEDLEVKLAFQDDLVEKLDAAVRELGDRVVALADEVTRLRGELTRLNGEAAASLLEEKPPHY